MGSIFPSFYSIALVLVSTFIWLCISIIYSTWVLFYLSTQSTSFLARGVTRSCLFPTRFVLSYVQLRLLCAVILPKKKKLKKRNETTQSNKKPHHRNILTEALDENINKWKNLFVPWFSLCFPILHLIA